MAKNCSALLPSRFPWEEKSTKSVRLISPRSEQIPRVLVCCSMKRKREKKKKNNNRARLFPPPSSPLHPTERLSSASRESSPRRGSEKKAADTARKTPFQTRIALTKSFDSQRFRWSRGTRHSRFATMIPLSLPYNKSCEISGSAIHNRYIAHWHSSCIRSTLIWFTRKNAYTPRVGSKSRVENEKREREREETTTETILEKERREERREDREEEGGKERGELVRKTKLVQQFRSTVAAYI